LSAFILKYPTAKSLEQKIRFTFYNVYVYSPIKATLHARHTETDSETDKQTDREYRQYDKLNKKRREK